MSLRINNTNTSKINIESEAQSLTSKKQTNFHSILTHNQEIQNKEVDSFLAELDLKGKKLAASLTLKDLFEFKNMVKNFLKSTLGQSKSMQQESLWDFKGQPKIMARVIKINEALEELGRDFLESHQESLKILSKIDKIKGLILDLFI